MAGFIWLVSYPKSGNTWVRILLNNYRLDANAPPVLDIPLLGDQQHLSRHLFDEATGLVSSELSEDELQQYRLLFHQQFVRKFDGISFAKVHEAYRPQPGVSSAFPANAACKAVYLVRNPLDIVPSFAHHENVSSDRIIDHMADCSAVVRHSETAFDERLGSWSDHVSGWTRQDAIETLVVRYEDMLADPRAAFSRLILFSGLPLDSARLAKAINMSRFDRLQASERAIGFRERPFRASHFFRSGRSGAWRETLTARQVERIVADHSGIMQTVGYA